MTKAAAGNPDLVVEIAAILARGYLRSTTSESVAMMRPDSAQKPLDVSCRESPHGDGATGDHGEEHAR